MEADILVSHSSAPFPDPPPTHSPRINLLASKHQGAHHLLCLHGEETQELPFTSLAHDYHVLTYRRGLTYIRAYPTHVYMQTYFEQIFLKPLQDPGNFLDALSCLALVGLSVPGPESLTLRVSPSLGATEAGIVSSCSNS